MRKLLVKLLFKLLDFEYTENKGKMSEAQKMNMYHAAYIIPEYEFMLQRMLKKHIRDAALVEGNMDMINFQRGAIFTLQTQLKTMRRYQGEWTKLQDSKAVDKSESELSARGIV